MLDSLLISSGLNQSETTIVLHLLRTGPSPAAIIAKRTGLKRPTVYAILNNLMQVGAITRQKKDAVTYFTAVSVSMLPKVLENHARVRFDAVRHATELMQPELRTLQTAQEIMIGGYEITTLESSETVYAHYEEVLMSGSFCAIFNPQTALATPLAKEITQKFLEESAHAKTHIREIAVDGAMAKWYREHIHNKNHKLKLIPPHREIIIDMLLSKNSVVLHHYDPSHELGVKITQPDFYKSMMTVFEMLWEKY